MNQMNLAMQNKLLLKNHLLVAICFAATFLQSSWLFGQTCPTPVVACSGNGQSSTMKFITSAGVQNDVTANIGDTLFYQLRVAVPADQSCAATNVDAYFMTADGTVVKWLSGACIAANGGEIICPGAAACINTNLLKYTIRAQDVGKSFFLAEPNGLPGSGSNICFVAPAPNRVGALINAVGAKID